VGEREERVVVRVRVRQARRIKGSAGAGGVEMNCA
jgi:hypothetical protein